MMLSLTQPEELKVYSFIVRPAGYVATVEELGAAVLDYNLSSAFQKVAASFPGRAVTATSLGEVAVKTILDQVNVQNAPQPSVEPVAKVQNASKEQFLLNLKLASEEYMSDARDRRTLERLIQKMATP